MAECKERGFSIINNGFFAYASKAESETCTRFVIHRGMLICVTCDKDRNALPHTHVTLDLADPASMDSFLAMLG